MTAPSLAAAVREAEEYLHLWDRGAYAQSDGIRILRSLLAALPAEGEPPAPQPAPTSGDPRCYRCDREYPFKIGFCEDCLNAAAGSLPPEVEAACIERGREEVWADVLDSLRAVYGKDMPYDESPCELIVDLVKPSSLPPSVEAAAEALRLRGCVEKILAFLLPIDVVRLVCRTTPETRQSAATAIGNARLACDYALNGGKPENILAPERLSSARSAKGGE